MKDRQVTAATGSADYQLVRLEAGSSTALIDPVHGGTVLSVAVDGRELLAQDTGQMAPIPRYGSFVLAPWVGEMREGLLRFRDEAFRIPANVGRHAVHGQVLDRPWHVESRSASAVTLSCHLGAPWPFQGSVHQTVRLDPAGLTQSVEVVAESRSMPVSIGWHPWFQCLEPGLTHVSVRAAAMLELDSELIPTGRILEVTGETDLRGAPILGERRIDVVYVDVASPADIVQPDLDLRISFDPSISVVVVYATEGAICVEPWSAWPDAITMAEIGFASGVSVLEPGQQLEHWMRWSWLTPDPPNGAS